MRQAVLITGSNQGDRQANLELAVSLLVLNGIHLRQFSSFYESAAWGNTEQPGFLNQVLVVSSSMQPTDLMQTILSIEHSMGRVRLEKWEPRVIDIDILFIEDKVICVPGLEVPHPQIAGRRFTLLPLNEVMPDHTHPISGKTMRELLEECDDPLPVHIFEPR